MTPRTAGILGMVAGLVIAVLAGLMIAHPPVSIVGAFVLVAGTVLFAIAATWTVRPSWGESSWPDASISAEKAQTRLRRVSTAQCVVAPLLIGAGVWQLGAGQFGGINIFLGAVSLIGAVSTLRGLHRLAGRV